MKKLLIILISSVLVLLLLLFGALLFSYTHSGNSLLKSYLASELEEAVGLPVEVQKFTFNANKVTLLMQINKQMNVEVVSKYDLLSQSFEGIYRVHAKDFQYEELLLRQMKVQGHFKGQINHVTVDGVGTVLDAPLTYSLSLVAQQIQKVEAKIKKLSLAEVLVLSGQKKIATGQIDVDIDMPNIGEGSAQGYGHLILHNGLFNRALVRTLYHYSLPPKSHVEATIDATLKGQNIAFNATSTSNLFSINVTEGKVNLKEKDSESIAIHANYDMDVKELRVLSANKLAGALSLGGKVALVKDTLALSGESHSLGGTFHFNLAKKLKVRLKNIALGKVLTLLQQPAYAKGMISGKLDFEKNMEAGQYDIVLNQGRLESKQIEKRVGYVLPSQNTFTLVSKGTIEKQVLNTKLTIRSSVANVDVTQIEYGVKTKILNARYDLKVHDIAMLMAKNKKIQHAPLRVNGTMHYDKTLTLDGKTSGLAKKLQFHYNSKKATLDAKALMLEKLFALSGLPQYVTGTIDAKANIKEMPNMQGSFSLHSKALKTDAKAMQALLGKPLTMQVSMVSDGTLKKGMVYAKSQIKTDMGTLNLQKTVFNTKTKVLKSAYTLDIPDMQKLYPLTEKKLYGKMHVTGTLVQDTLLKATGLTYSLGGQITYTLQGNVLTSKINAVPIENMMGMMGVSQTVLGKASGIVKYHLKKKTGVADISITGFQIKPNKTTNTIKMFIGKDPSRIIFKSTKVHATMKGDITTYSLYAKGTRASIDIIQGRLNRKTQAHSAKFKFVYEKYVITGSIGGTADNPKVAIDPSSMLKSRVEKEIGKGLDKVLKGKMGGFLKGLPF